MDSLQTKPKLDLKFDQSNSTDQTAQEEHQVVTEAKLGAAHEPKSPQVSWCKNSITIDGKTHLLPTNKEYILHEYADVFKGIGTLPGGPYHIKLIGSYKPVQHPPRSVPLGIQSAYRAELDRLVKEGIIMEVHGVTENTHDGTVLVLCETIRLNNLSLNAKKMQFKSTDCKFFGHKLTPDGIKVDPKKIEAIQMDLPQNVTSLQSFNGMVNYLKKFSPVLSELSESLRRLCKSGVEWAWESKQQNAFEAIKRVIMTLPVLAYFDKTKKHTIQCDASKKGLGAVLLQESKPVMYMSRALTETEQRYSNIERELLAIVFALERLNHHTFGRTITVQSDHQPLQSIWKKLIASTSPRLQRLLLRLAHYDIDIEFLCGKENVIADALSRVCPLQSINSKTKESNIDIIPVHHIMQNAQISQTRLQELRLATQSDPTLCSLSKTIHEGWPQSKKDCPEQVLEFWDFRQEMSEENGILYKSHRLIVPHSKRLETLKVLHMGHYAIEKM